MATRLHPYLNFDGECKEAMQFYKDALGGRLQLQTWEEAGQAKTEEEKARIMHASLESGDLTLFGCDSPVGMRPQKGSDVLLTIVGDDLQALTQSFEALAEGGKVKMPLQKTFWGDTYGMLTDKYGFLWAVNISGRKA